MATAITWPSPQQQLHAVNYASAQCQIPCDANAETSEKDATRLASLAFAHVPILHSVAAMI